MSEVSGVLAQPSQTPAVRIRIQDQWWILVAVAIMIVAIEAHQRWFLNAVHVFSGILWTGTDIFMGFILGPVLRRLDLPTRRAVLSWLMPRMLFYMPTMAAITTTTGWFMADQLGYLALGFPVQGWLIAAGVIVVILTIQGFGILLPTNLRVFFEMRKDQPDVAKIQRLMLRYVRVVAMQGAMQVLTVIVMAKFATGF